MNNNIRSYITGFRVIWIIMLIVFFVSCYYIYVKDEPVNEYLEINPQSTADTADDEYVQNSTYVTKRLDALVNGEKFADSSIDIKAELAEDILQQLINEGYLEDYTVNIDNVTFAYISYQFPDGRSGAVGLTELSEEKYIENLTYIDNRIDKVIAGADFQKGDLNKRRSLIQELVEQLVNKGYLIIYHMNINDTSIANISVDYMGGGSGMVELREFRNE